MRVIIALLATTLLTIGLTPTAHAVHWRGWLLLTVVSDAPTGQPDYRVLTCGPDGGSHPSPVIACGQLRRASGQPAAIPEEPGPCTLELNTTRVTARGWWGASPRFFHRVYSNPCVAIRDTGGVLFDW